MLQLVSKPLALIAGARRPCNEDARRVLQHADKADSKKVMTTTGFPLAQTYHQALLI